MPRSTFIAPPPAPKTKAAAKAKAPATANTAKASVRTKPATAVTAAGPSALERGFGFFLDLNRRNLAIGAIAACGALTGIQALPAEADIIQEEVQASTLQSFRVPAAAVIAAPSLDRDAWTVSLYSLVQWPVPHATTMSSGFGYRSCAGCSSYHEGLDLNPGNGFPVQAIADGVVVESEFSGALGAHVVIEHVIDGQVVQSQYGHMQGDSLVVSVGQQVTMGQQLGLVGSTGQSTGPHLHFGIIIGGELIDPEPWLAQFVNQPY